MTEPPDSPNASLMAAEPGGISLLELARVFGIIGVSSFGGGLSGWMYRELVERRRWLSSPDFLTGRALARTLPGVNVVNLAIWAGHRLRGGVGALVASASVLAGPFVAISVLAALYKAWSSAPLAHLSLLGVAAAGLGMSLAMGVKSFRLSIKTSVEAAIVVAFFVAIGILRLPLLPVTAVLAPLSLVWSFTRVARRED